MSWPRSSLRVDRESGWRTSGRTERPEGACVATCELLPREGVVGAAEVFERVRRSDAAELRAYFQVRAHRESLHQTRPERITNPGWILDAMRFHRRNIDLTAGGQDRASVFALGHD